MADDQPNTEKAAPGPVITYEDLLQVAWAAELLFVFRPSEDTSNAAGAANRIRKAVEEAGGPASDWQPFDPAAA